MACMVLQDGEALHGFQQASQQIAVRSAYRAHSFSRLTHKQPCMDDFPFSNGECVDSACCTFPLLRRAFKETNSPLMEHLPPLPGKGQASRYFSRQ